MTPTRQLGAPRPKRGSIKEVRRLIQPGNEEGRRRAKQELEAGMFAHSTWRSKCSRVKLWVEICQSQGVEPFPINCKSIELVGSILKAAGYRSGADYLSAACSENSLQGHTLGQAERECLTRVKRSLLRGLGAPKRARTVSPGELEAIYRNARGAQEQRRANAYILGSWFLLRGDELCKLQLKDVMVDSAVGRVVVRLRSSKTDPQCIGVSREHGCSCGATIGRMGRDLCPVRAAESLKGMRRAESASADDNLLVDSLGQPLDKSVLRRQLKKDIENAGARTPDGFSLHSLRRGGCQMLARSGLDHNQIRAFGRWSKDSKCVDIYIEEALLVMSPLFAEVVVRAETQLVELCGDQYRMRSEVPSRVGQADPAVIPVSRQEPSSVSERGEVGFVGSGSWGSLSCTTANAGGYGGIDAASRNCQPTRLSRVGEKGLYSNVYRAAYRLI
ncbi:hypothetical protein FOZ60_003792 [Perkinsus olseni]|uniref:Tyr recombinase domain-containing protein n=1 Tax=Perkinsus olseni TaxID=32597 RepID=A0A7J6NWY2_PEROL|nr:hypothetical protein FOZ60_003792 [Perkinsus olseni]